MKSQRRPKGEGSITKMPNGSLKMTITLGVGVDGKQKRRSVTAKTKTELMRRVAELRVQAGQKPTQDAAIYFSDLLEMFMKEKERVVKEGTLRNYKYIEPIVFAPLRDYRLDRITPEVIDYVLDNVTKVDGAPIQDSTLFQMRAKLAAVLNFAVDKGFIVSSPMSKTRRRKQGKRRVDVLVIPTEEDMKQLLSDARAKDNKKKKPHLYLYPLFLLAIATGMRLGELLNIDRVRDIDTKRGTVHIHSQLTIHGCDRPLKTEASTRTIYVQQDVLKRVLTLVPPLETSSKLWGFNGKQICRSTADTLIQDFLKTCTYLPKGFTFHCFRHYHATQLLLKGINPKEVSKRLGHASVKTTLDLYAHWIPEMDEQAANSINTDFIL